MKNTIKMTNKMKMHKKAGLIGNVILFALLCTLASPVAYAEEYTDYQGETVTLPSEGEDWETVQVDSVEDLKTLAKRCELDSASDKLKVELTQDISFEGLELEPIPYFNGIFDGRGYAIKGISYTNKTEPLGLFCILGKDAAVKNLYLSGNFQPSQACDYLGALAGENRGIVYNCSFQGVVSGKNYVGGLVGQNSETGKIITSDVRGAVLGENMTGGLAGYNCGLIMECENYALVNTESVDFGADSAMKDLTINLDFDKLNTQNAAVQQDMGGIAGYSNGFLVSCSNQGQVGYQHQSYNVGGIVGRSNGYVKNCTNKAAVTGRKDIGGIVGQMEPYIQETVTTSQLYVFGKQMEEMNTLLDQASRDAQGAGRDVRNAIDDLSKKTSTAGDKAEVVVKDVWQQKNDSPVETPEDIKNELDGWKKDSEDIKEDLENNLENSLENNLKDNLEESSKEYKVDDTQAKELWDSMQDVSKQLEHLNKQVQGHGDLLENDLKQINEQYNAIADTMEKLKNTEWKVQDTSVSAADTMLLGAVRDCINQGEIYGDLNAGGIAGVMGEESSVDPEDEISLSIDEEKHTTYETRAVLEQCVNYGSVTVKRNYAGGLTGRGEEGYIRNAENYGMIETQGDYAGGVAASSQIPIENCYVKCTLSGSKYIGGIIGQGVNRTAKETGSNVTNCRSLVVIQNATKFYGTVSGTTDGSFEQNTFVSDELMGLGTYSAKGQAYPVSYEKIIQGENVPDEFKKLHLTFKAEDTVLKSVDFQYGADFTDKIYPVLPEKKGYYAVWDRTELKHLVSDTVVSVVYKPYIESVSSEKLRATDRPVFYVMGDFTEEDRLNISQIEVMPDALEQMDILHDNLLIKLFYNKTVEEIWKISLPRDGKEEHELRFLPSTVSTKEPEIYVKDGGQYDLLEGEMYGSYESFHIAGDEITLVVLSTTPNYGTFAVAAAVLLTVCVAAIVLTVSVKRISKGKKAAKATEDVPENEVLTVEKILENSEQHEIIETMEAVPNKPRKGKRRIIRVVLGSLALFLTGSIVFFTIHIAKNPEILYSKVAAYLAMKMETDTQSQLDIHMSVTEGRQEKSWDALFWKTQEGDKKISCLEINGVKLYQNDKKIYLENGMVFDGTSLIPEYGNVFPKILEVLDSGELSSEKVDGGTKYRLKLENEAADTMLSQIMGEYGESIEKVESVSVTLFSNSWDLKNVEIKGNVQCKNGDRLLVDCMIKVISAENAKEVAVPKELVGIMEKSPESVELTPQLLKLLYAFGNLYKQEKTACEVSVSATGSILSVKDILNWYRVQDGDQWIQCVSKNGISLYYSEKGACTSKGTTLTKDQQQVIDAADILNIIYPLCLEGDIQFAKEEGKDIFTLDIDEVKLADLMKQLLPETAEIEKTLMKGKIQIAVTEDGLDEASIQISGKTKVLFSTQPFLLRVDIRQINFPVDFTVPEEVKDSLK